MILVVERDIGKSFGAGEDSMSQITCQWQARRSLVALVLVASVVLLSTMHASAEGDTVDWKALIQQHKGRESLTVDERFELAIAYANTGDIRGAQREFEALESLGWRTDAVVMLSAAEERLISHPNSVMDLNIVAFVSFVLEDHERSCSAFERILEIDPSNEWPRAYLAWTLGSMGRIDEGIEHLERVVKKHPLNLRLRALLLYAKTQR